MEDTALEAVSADVSNAWEAVNSLVDGFIALVPQMLIALIVFVLFYVASLFIRRLVFSVVANRSHKGLASALSRLTHIAVVFAGFLVAVSVVAPSVGAAELLSVLGVGSVAIGFAFRDILQNFLAGIILLIRQPFKTGDWVRFGDFEGTVASISIRSTWIETFDGRDVAVPNGEVFTNAMTVVTKSDILRGDYEFGVAYDADIAKAKSVIIDVVNAHENVLKEPAADVGVSDLAGSSVNIKARWWTKNGDFYRTKVDIIERVKIALDDNKISIPFPTRTLEINDEFKEALISSEAAE